jgi:hypothetical protein
MTNDELLAKIDAWDEDSYQAPPLFHALRAVVELHKPWYRPGVMKGYPLCNSCYTYEGYKISYPCTTIQAIEKALI